jgi:hypothetical protein
VSPTSRPLGTETHIVTMIELRWLLPADDEGQEELRHLQDTASKLSPPGIIEARSHGPSIAVHARVMKSEHVAELAVVTNAVPEQLAEDDDRATNKATLWFRCAIPDNREQARRVEWVRGIANSLGPEGDVHFSTDAEDGTVYCNVLYSGSEGARLILTKLYLATGEKFILHRGGGELGPAVTTPQKALLFSLGCSVATGGAHG